MNKLNKTQVALVLIVVILGIGVFLFKVPQNMKGKQAQTQNAVLSIAGSVGAVNVSGNSFALINAKEGKEVTVKVGNNTKMVRLVFPFDLKNPPANKTFTPERKPIALKDLKTGDQVFVRASEPIKAGQDVINPIEIQILP